MKNTLTLVIMDGFGYSDNKVGNAITVAETPNLDRIFKENPTTLIHASGKHVGLPDGLMGNSEVGHLNIGAGRVVYQDISMIDKAIEDGEFFKNEALKGAMENLSPNNALHIVGLLSDGGVHSSIEHAFALLDMAKKKNVQNVYFHAITDGRDTAVDSGMGFVQRLQAKIDSVGLGSIATVVGRYFYMDRDKRWDRVEKGYNVVFNGVGTRFQSAEAGIQASYKNSVMDEFIEPIVVGNYKGVQDGDSVIFYNFRADRARQISHAITDEDFEHFARIKKDVYYVGMTEYDTSLKNIHIAFPPKDIRNTLGEYLATCGLNQVRIAETEKYAHVTFFFNGGVEAPNKNEDRILVNSPKVATYDLQPNMSASEVTEKAIESVGKYDVMIVNFANCDMVGHTGVFNAAVQAVETVDTCVKKLLDKVLEVGGIMLLTADHGNAECMYTEDGVICTAHTTNLVPFSIIGCKENIKLKEDKALCDIAPTMLELLNLSKPSEMTGESIIERV
ncbi:MAG: 2,3-bisphosphoglycerate-independent phosphoglycerate mutase [Clostridiales bacterium]|nr:2,3-bisphosphoglycerate-independent phosphoglycerate mutase [Clostridiales bacterium]